MMKSFDIKQPADLARPAGQPERRRGNEPDEASADFAGSMASFGQHPSTSVHEPPRRDAPEMPRAAIPDLPLDVAAIAEPAAPAAAPLCAIAAVAAEVHFDTRRLQTLPVLALSESAGHALPHKDMRRAEDSLKILTIELAPDDDLGTIKAVLRLKSDGLAVQLQSDRGAVAAKLHGSAQSLAASLEHAGYVVETVSAQLSHKPLQSTAPPQASDAKRTRGERHSGETDDEASTGHRPSAGEPVFL